MATTRKQLSARVPTQQVLSAAASLGGKMSTATARMAITNAFLEDSYTGVIYVGSQKKPCNVLFDTGSSTLAVDGTFYKVNRDKTAEITKLAQEVSYADSSRWMGAVVRTGVAASADGLLFAQVHVAVAFHATRSMFGRSQGILGLAYTQLNEAYEMPGLTVPPRYTYNQIQDGRMKHIEPYFTELERQGLVANKFALYTRRSLTSHATRRPATDPLNNGYLILGGGEENTDLYTGSFQVARVLHDTYYNTHLKSVIVGNSAPIVVPRPTKASGNPTNSVVDSGTTGLLLDQHLFNAILEKLSPGKDKTLAHLLRTGATPMRKLHLADWPSITFVLEGALGKDVVLEVTPQTYWQTDSPRTGDATAVIYGDNGAGKGSSTLGLPLMNNYFTVFDRSVNKGLGVVSFAKIR